jgi:hypothetical protein
VLSSVIIVLSNIVARNMPDSRFNRFFDRSGGGIVPNYEIGSELASLLGGYPLSIMFVAESEISCHNGCGT